MKVELWGTRGSIASAGAGTVRYGGDTAAVELRTDDDSLVVLDAGSGIRALGAELTGHGRVDILLSHLHMDHIQGLPFFAPLLEAECEVHIWGPMSTTHDLRARLSRYLSPPLFPVRVRELPNVHFHDVTPSTFEVRGLEITADLVLHPGTTLGYRITEGDKVLTYIPDHEPALGDRDFPCGLEWMSGRLLADGADVLIHDSQYTDQEYAERIGWGHSSISHLALFAATAEARRLVTFHHDPSHADEFLDELHDELVSHLDGTQLIPGTAHLTVDV